MPSEWCPDWYGVFVAAEELRVPPWELAGFTYASAALAPICWQHWAVEYRNAVDAARQARASAMMR